ncbi:contractile injection system tape measure protein [Citrobacter sp. NCU1]|nr:contractile injection system tape measure protein [Citrobacter sp. NCU1]
MDKSSELFHTSLKTDCADIIERFAQQSIADVFINSLILDLGEIPIQDFEFQFRQRFQQQLQQQLLMYDENYQPHPKRWPEESQQQLLMSSEDYPLHPERRSEDNRLTGWLHQKILSEPLRGKKILARACLDAKKRRRLLTLLSREGGVELCTLLGWNTSVTLQGLLLQGLRYFQHYPHIPLPPPREEALMVITPEQDEAILKALFSFPPSPTLLPWLSLLWQQPAVRRALKNCINAEVAGLLQKNVPVQKTESASNQKLASKFKAKVTQPQVVIQPQQVPVCNAGLVALWPLLPDLFQRLGLWEKGGFTQDNARQQAANCLDWLIWQDDFAQEGQMALTRWLCGLLPEEECGREEVTEQYEFVLETWLAQLPLQLPGWRILSVADVRALFLQRSGTLVFQENGLLLQVDPQPFDVLLGDWPWPLTSLMLPWLPVSMAIDWPQPGFDRAEAHYA